MAATVATATLNLNPVVEFVVAGLIAVALYRSDWVRANVKRITATGGVTAVLGGLYALRGRVLDLVGPRVRTAIEVSPLWGIALASGRIRG